MAAAAAIATMVGIAIGEAAPMTGIVVTAVVFVATAYFADPPVAHPVAAAAPTPTQISTSAMERPRAEAMSADTTARASHRVAVRKMDSIEEPSVPARG